MKERPGGEGAGPGPGQPVGDGPSAAHRGRSRQRLRRWLDQRTGWPSAVAALMAQPIPGGAAWFHALGTMAAVLFLLQALTGVFLAFYYAPSAQTAWASVAFIQDQVTAGWLVRGLHSFGSSALLVVTGLHFLQVLVWGAYRAPRELNWILGCVLLLLVLGSAVTGYGLPWDQAGYWAKLVETGILGTMPLVGPSLERLAQGGGGYGNLTVVRFYALHAFVLPAAQLLLVGLHVALAVRHRLTPHWRLTREQAERAARPYWPRQAFRDGVGSALAVLVVVGFVLARHGAPLEGPADPASAYLARPEWYALPLYQLRRLLEGPLELVATLLLPGLVGGLVAALPFLDRGPDRSPARRLPVLAGAGAGVLGMAVLAGLAVYQDAGDPSFQRHRARVAEEAARARALALRGVLPEGGPAVWRNDPLHEARALFQERCATCHPLDGHGGGEGPDLLDYNSRAWLLAFFREPYGPRFFAGAKKPERGRMRPVEGSPGELAALAEFVHAQSGATDIDVRLLRQGEALFSEKGCDSCHGVDGKEEARGPNLLGRGSQTYLRRVIADSAVPLLYGDRAHMPRFADRLSERQIDGLASFVLSLARPAEGAGPPAGSGAR